MPKKPDVLHEELPVEDPMRRHRPEYSDLCPTCSARALKRKNVDALHAALVEFGYAGLTREEVAAAYDGALAGEDPGADIIRLMVARQMREAGLIPGKES